MLPLRLKKLILIRLLFATLLLYAPNVFEDNLGVPFFAASSLICVSSAIYVLWYLTRRWLRQLVVIQIFGDILLETYLVFFTGGADSIFATLYVLSILSAALVLGEKKAVLQTTLLSSLGYTSSSWAAFREGLSPMMPNDPVYFLYGTAMKVAIFFAVGYLSRYLSQTVIELRDQLKLSERLSSLGEVASKIAHEVRNPLSSIRTAAEVLRDSLSGKLSPQEEKMMVIVESESDRLTKTLQRILDYAKPASPNPKMLMLDPLIERTLSLARLHSHVQSNGVAVEKKYDSSKIHLYADEEQVLSALLNLILNAYQAMPQGGVLRIGAEEELRGTKIHIEDSGGGIPPEKIKDLFLPFKSSKKGGTGLGLAEVHKIVTLHEGKVEAESRSGKGTTFHLFFPKP